MKKLILAFGLLPVIGANAQTVKKVVLEDFTGINCCWCPEGTLGIEALEKSMGANFIGIQIHTGPYTPASSPLKTAEGDAIDAMAAPGGYPNGAVDRKKYSTNTTISMDRNSWASAVNARKSIPAIVSVSFANAKRINATDFEMDVKVKFSSAPVAGNTLKLQVVVLEDKIAATGVLAQKNCSPTYKPGESPLLNYIHNNVMRKALGGAWGYSDIPATPVVGTEYTKHITFSVPTGAAPVGWNRENVRLVAFVAYDGAASADKKEILNAEGMNLRDFAFPTDVNDVKSAVNIMGAYPNPAQLNDVVKIAYNTQESGKVTLNVLNAVGQVVATPYVSDEVSGVHTIHWKPADNGLAAGLYILQLSTTSGTHTQRITLQ